ncbi:MAG: choice-of-anchor J domain-containing protein [Flavobacterium psychrophilum]
MKKLLLSLFILVGLNANAQVPIFEDSFEFYDNFAIADVGDWTLTDVDLKLTYGFTGITFPNTGVAKSFQVFNATATTPALTPSATANWSARTGDKHMVCFAASSPPPVNNDWLISPQITLGNTNTIKFWAKACDATYFQERFSVWVSTAGTAVSDFVQVSTGAFTTTPNINWTEYTYNLAASYDGLPVYVGIKCTSPDMFGFAIDDFSVSAVTLSNNDFFKGNFSVYPNPATTILNINNRNNLEITSAQITDVNGRVVSQVNGTVSQINIADLTAGVYFLKVTSSQGVGTTRVVKN